MDRLVVLIGLVVASEFIVEKSSSYDLIIEHWVLL